MMDKLNILSQDLLSSVKNKALSQKLEGWLENVVQRWENLAQKLESSSKQVSHCYYSLRLLQLNHKTVKCLKKS